jgi:HPt (histidine-containing phosphotransfer) domain-containing protein
VAGLAGVRFAVLDASAAAAALDQIRDIAHRLAGSAGIFGFDELGDAAADLEDAVIANLEGRGSIEAAVQTIDRLLLELDRAGPTPKPKS